MERSTLFVALRVRSPVLLAALTRIQKQISLRLPELRPCMIPAAKLHLTLAVLSPSEGSQEALVQTFRTCAALLKRHFPDPVAAPLSFNGLDFFPDAAGEIRVLYAKVEAGEEKDALCRLSRDLRSALYQGAGAGADHDDDAAFMPHVTLFKTSKDRDAVSLANKANRTQRVQTRLQRYVFDQLKLGEMAQSLGEQPLDELQLLSMVETSPDGYYRSFARIIAQDALASLPLPQSLSLGSATTITTSRRSISSTLKDHGASSPPAAAQPSRAAQADSSTTPASPSYQTVVQLSRWVDSRGQPIALENSDDGAAPLPKREPRRRSSPVVSTRGGVECYCQRDVHACMEKREVKAVEKGGGHRKKGRDGVGGSVASDGLSLEDSRAPQSSPAETPADGQGLWLFLYGRDMGLGRASLPKHNWRVAYSVAGVLPEYSLVFNGVGGKENIVLRSQLKGCVGIPAVHGVLQKLSEAQADYVVQAQLSYGNMPLAVTVETYDGRRLGATTFACRRIIQGSREWDAQYTFVGSALPPPDRHVSAIQTAATHWRLSTSYLTWLATLPTIKYEARTREHSDGEDDRLVCDGGGRLDVDVDGQVHKVIAPAAGGTRGGVAKADVDPAAQSTRRRRGRLQHAWL